MAMYDDNTKAEDGIKANKPASLLERLSDQLSKQEVMLADLESKLNFVSDRSPSDGNAERSDSVHLAVSVERVERNNAQIRRLLNDLTI